MVMELGVINLNTFHQIMLCLYLNSVLSKCSVTTLAYDSRTVVPVTKYAPQPTSESFHSTCLVHPPYNRQQSLCWTSLYLVLSAFDS